MTRRSSVRAQARRIYRDSKQASEAADPSSLRFNGQAPTPDPPSLCFGEASPPSPCSGAASLTARVRALYEDSAVPVREIASRAGVTERTIYKYAHKHGWKPRYRWARDRRWRARATFAPAKGAGGRFIARADKDKPVARGLKALDAAGAARAAAACAKADRLAQAAQAEADYEHWAEQHVRGVERWSRAVCKLVDYLVEREQNGGWRGPGRDMLEVGYSLAVDMAKGGLDYASKESTRARQRAAELAVFASPSGAEGAEET